MVLVGSFAGLVGSVAEECPLNPQTAYRTKTEPAVYAITRQCTKRVFLNEVTYFAFFSSWNDVKITSGKILMAIPDDARGPMRIKGQTTPSITSPIVPSTSTPKLTPVSTIENTTPSPITAPIKTVAPPIIQTPTTPTSPLITKKPPLNGVMKSFLQCPTETERTNIEKDFNILWNSAWNTTPFSCVYETIAPSRLPLYATLRLLQHIEFSKPLPFTHGQNLYSYLTAKKITLIPSQSCVQYSTGWNYTINLGGIFAHTHGVRSGSPSCELVGNGFGESLGDNNFVYNPIYKAGTFVHEAHHAIQASTHNGINGGDKDINENSAWAAQFYFYAWVTLYADNVDAATKSLAKNAAIDIINTRFSKNKCPQDTELKNVVNVMQLNTCQ